MSVSHKNMEQTAVTGWQAFKLAYLNKNALIMLLLGFSSGLPYLLIFSTLGLWLREAGVDRATVTMFAWAGLGYSFKFLWSPLIDKLNIPYLCGFLGQRRSWLLVAQLFITLSLLAIAYTQPVADTQTSIEIMAIFAVLLGFSSATQDIVIDAYRIELVPKSALTAISAIYVFGYRLGLIIAGAGALYLATYFGSVEGAYSYSAWKQTYIVMAMIMLVGILTTLTAKEPNSQLRHPIKQQMNDKIMGIYATIALIPMFLYGFWYFLNELSTRIFQLDTQIFVIPEQIAVLAGYYGAIMLCLAPLALIFLLLNQPQITTQMTKNSLQVDKQSYLKLVLFFVVCVSVFVFAFRTFGVWVVGDVKHSHLVGFLLESLRFVMSMLTTFATGYLLIITKIVPKEVAVANWIEPILAFFRTYGKKAVLILLLIGVYRISDIVAGNISNIFYQDLGFTKVQIADASKLLGLTMSIFGGFFGGFLAQKMNIIKAMMVGAILACMTNLLFIWVFNSPTLNNLYLAVIADNLAAGLASAVFVAFLSALTSIRFTAVQYALFSSLMTLSPKILGGYSGAIVEATSYPTFFMITFLMGIPVLLLVYLVGKYIDLGDKTLTFKDE